MTDNLDLAERLDRSFGEGPALPPAHDRLLAGRRALVRRRLAAAACATAVVVVIGTTFALVSGGDGRPEGSRLDPATAPPTQVDSSVSEPEPPTPSDPEADVELVGDVLLVAEGVEVTRQIEDPLDLTPPDYSLAVEYVRDGRTTWALLDNRGGVSSDPARKAFDNLEDWVAEMVALENGDVGLTLVEFGNGEQLQPLPGVEILEQTGDVDLPSFAGAGDRTAVARVTFEGKRWFVLARQIQGSPPEYIPTAGAVGGRTIADFLEYAQAQYSGGEGLR